MKSGKTNLKCLGNVCMNVYNIYVLLPVDLLVYPCTLSNGMGKNTSNHIVVILGVLDVPTSTDKFVVVFSQCLQRAKKATASCGQGNFELHVAYDGPLTAVTTFNTGRLAFNFYVHMQVPDAPESPYITQRNS